MEPPYEQDAASINKEDALSITHSYRSDESADTTDAEIETKGKARPGAFRSLLGEIAFIFTIYLSLMMSEYFTSGFNIILPHLSTAIGIAPKDRTWPTTVPNLAAGALLLPFARVCDRFGSRVIFMGGHAWLGIWSMANSFSTGTVFTVICRAMQGIGFAAFLPAGVSLLGQVYTPGPRKNLVYCLYGAFACMGFYFGIFTASISVQFMNWQWYFRIGAMVEVLIVAGGFFTIPRHLDDANILARMDWWGTVTIVPGVGLLTFALGAGGHATDGWRTPHILVAFALSGLLLSAAVYTQGWVSTQPLVPPRTFRPLYMRRILGVMLCSNGIWSLFLFYSSLYITNIVKPTPILTAACYTPLAIGGISLAITGGFILHLIPSYVLLLVSGAGFLGCTLILALIPMQSPVLDGNSFRVYWTYLLPAMCSGTIGINLMLNVTNVYCTSAVPKRDQALIGGVINSLSYLGAAVWLGMSDAAMTVIRSFRDNKMGEEEQYKVGFWSAVCLAVVALGLASTVRVGSAAAKPPAGEPDK